MSDKQSILKRIRSSALIKNPLLFEAIGLCPVVAIATSVKSAIFLALVTAIEMVICELLASLMLKNVRRYWRVALYVLFGVGIIFPITYITSRFFPEMSINMGVYLPLMAVNSLIALHCERVAVKRDTRDSLIDALSASLSYGAVTILVGIVREIIANGTFWGFDLKVPIKLNSLNMPFGGLILLGFMAAILKAFINKKYPESNPDKAFDTSEIRRSLRGTIRELMNDDYNPYGEENEAESTFQKVKKQKDEKVKKEKVKREKPKKEKKVKSKVKAKPSPPAQREEISDERTYLDDFSDMLTDLDAYKNRNEDNSSEDNGGVQE